MKSIEKEKTINELLEEMRNLQSVFTDLYVECKITGNYKDDRDSYGSVEGFKSIITRSHNVNNLIVTNDRFNKVNLENTYIKDGMLNISYNSNRKAHINIEFITKIYAMKEHDCNVY